MADADVDLSKSHQCAAWGLRLSTGCVHTTSDCRQPGKARKSVCAPLGGCAVGATVRLRVDMNERTMSFAVKRAADNEFGEAGECGVRLAKDVRPWALLCFKDDSIRIVPPEEC